ncbi:hypothetical protein PSY22_23320, partial [Shigella flexneri]|nr:hypothetical protein [Shigella flexneri]
IFLAHWSGCALKVLPMRIEGITNNPFNHWLFPQCAWVALSERIEGITNNPFNHWLFPQYFWRTGADAL